MRNNDNGRGGFGRNNDNRRGGYGNDSRRSNDNRGFRGGERRDGGRQGGHGGYGARPMHRTGNALRETTNNDLECSLVSLFYKNQNKEFNPKSIEESVRLSRHEDEKRLFEIIEKLVRENYILSLPDKKYKYNPDNVLYDGKIIRRPGPKIVFIPEGADSMTEENDVYIGEENLWHTLTNDTVKIRKFSYKKDGMETGQVVSVEARAKQNFVGVLDVSEKFAFLKVEKRVCPNDIFIPIDKTLGGQSGQKAIVEWVGWNDKDRNPNGIVIDVLGNVGDNNTEMHAILAEYGLPYDYPQELTEAAEKLSGEITEKDLAERIDYRPYTTFTVDPKDAKDFDDALSIRKLENGHWEAGVHIADVTHFVKEGDIINEEGLKRATSVYLVDRTVPMLPECISNVLCSLRPDEDKFAYSVLFEMDDDANVLNYKISHTVIRSNRRFTYEEAQEVIETGEGDYVEEILAMNRLAQIMRKRRFDNGAIAFEKEEVKFVLDETGRPLDIYFKVAKEANKMIEEFMLLANVTVAAHIGKVGPKESARTFVYRIHDTPDPDKLHDLNSFISRFGYKIKTEGKNREVSNSINQLLTEVKGKKEQNLIETIAVRAMQKAVYSTSNVGHYGLAFDYYTHFTSPIRRYPDMMVHRLLDKYAAGMPSQDKHEYDKLCEHCSAQEILASKAERSSISYKQVEYMCDKVGQAFIGVISSIQSWGIYVELEENKCEGMIPVRDLNDDFYEFDEKNYWLIGHNTHKTYQLGEEIVVKVAKTDLKKKQMDFELIGKKDEVDFDEIKRQEEEDRKNANFKDNA